MQIRWDQYQLIILECRFWFSWIITNHNTHQTGTVSKTFRTIKQPYKESKLVIQSFTVLHPESGFVVLLTCEWRFRSLPTAFLFWAADFVFYTSQGLSVCYFKSLSEVFIKRRQWRHTIVSSWFKILYSLYSLKDRRLVLHNLLRVNRRGIMCRWSESQHIENLFLDKCHYRWYGNSLLIARKELNQSY